MKKTITIGGRDLEFEANLGTSELYQILTGENLFEVLTSFRGVTKTDNRVYTLIDVYKRLMYVMNVQATETEVKAMRAKMNDDSYLEWTFGFEQDDITNETVRDIVELWQSTRKTHSTPKNL